MVKHLAFWIGFFASALLIIPVAVGVWSAAEDFARNMAVFLFGAVSVLTVIMVVGLFFRDRLLRKVLGSAETTLDEVISSLVKGVSAAANGDRAVAEVEAANFAKAATGWYVWSGFYRWVVASALGLLLAFGAFTGTVLLFEQNRKLSEQTVLMGEQGDLMRAQTERMQEQSTQFELQNEIMTISLVSEPREQLASTVERTTLGTLFVEIGDIASEPLFVSTDGSCGVFWNLEAQLSIPPSPSIIDAVVDLGIDKRISAQIRQALEFLVRDRDSAIAFGALQALDASGYVHEGNFLGNGFRNLAIMDGELGGSHEILFEDSLVTDFSCVQCRLGFSDSVAVDSEMDHASAYRTVLYVESSVSDGVRNIIAAENRPEEASDVLDLAYGPAGESSFGEFAVLTVVREERVCWGLEAIASDNELLLYFGPD